MHAGQRVDIIKRLTSAMAGWSYSEIDLVFKQFGVPWAETWEGEAKDYVMHFLGEAEDSTLAALDEYMSSGASDATTSRPATGVWSGDLFKLFLSHSSVDKTFVSDLKAALRPYGVEGFVAHEDIDPTAEWVQTILGALDTCDALAAILTDDFHGSSWCDQEVGHCIGMRKLVIPLARGLMPYGFMGRYQALKCKDAGAGDLARRIADILIAHPLSSGRMAEALVANLERSSTFAEAKANMALIQGIEVWTPDLLRKLEGTRKNSQVSNSWGVPESIRAIVSRNASPGADEDVEIPF